MALADRTHLGYASIAVVYIVIGLMTAAAAAPLFRRDTRRSSREMASRRAIADESSATKSGTAR